MVSACDRFRFVSTVQVIRIFQCAALIVLLVCAALFGVRNTSAGIDVQSQIANAGKRSTAAQQYESVKKQLQRLKPGVEKAKQRSEGLQAQAEGLRQKLVHMATRVQSLETQKARIESEILRLRSREEAISANEAHDRLRLLHLLAVLERLQADLPPPIALESSDALAAARGAMVLGASLPEFYRETAGLRRILDSLHSTRTNLLARRADSVRNAKTLTAARQELDQLLAIKKKEAEAASTEYTGLGREVEAIASKVSDLKSLLDRVSALRSTKPKQDMVVVASAPSFLPALSRPGSLLRPVIGAIVQGGPEGVGGGGAPGLTFAASPGASVVAPADCEVLFAGRYHKTGQVLILEISGGYDLVLAGLDRIDVRPGDQLLIGEPVGRMPLTGNGAKLYFEVRQNGRGVSPARWLGIDLKKAKKS